MDFVSALLSFNVPGILAILGGILLFSLFFEQVFGNKLRVGTQRQAAITGAILLLISAGLMIVGLFAKIDTAPDSVNQNTAATSLPDPNIADIDKHSSSFYSFHGISDPKFNNGSGRIFVLQNPPNDFDYKFEYDIPERGNGYAGFVFTFSPNFNFTPYTYLEIALSLGDSEANCDVYLKEGTIANYIRICDGSLVGALTKDKIELSRANDMLIVKIPLLNEFKDIDLRQVEELGFSVNSDFSRGFHSFTINSVRLIK